ncbi:mRNA-decapping enzyme 1B [Condylostylus longicornis]|uniref:mRNA-decapping enzyme 1B n=1 Tax=Condylostylus longicornis TaxID=2530218 RepID=UPI00244DC147|nr:mRNA-decapping enzyme 1B [Condylostylus longicornis]XP_055383128.1 mRNA-decapping enzyme 1B [Condylostylus longicornis]
MADKTETRMNLTAIKRIDPYAKDIIDSSAHVAFYTFNSEENEWEKTDVEGALFIYSRNAEPFHSIFINNRINTNSFVEPVTGHLELQSQPPFLLYRNERSRIRGFWFYNSSECDRIGEIVRRLITECGLKKDGTNIQKNLDVVIPSNNHINIFTMLSKAQEEFNNSANTNPVVIQTQGGGSIGNMCMPTVQNLESRTLFSSIQQNNINNNINNNKVHSDLTSQSVMNFFANAKPAVTSEAPPLFQRLISSPVPVEQIEKQQRASTPHESGRVPSPISSNISMGIKGIENHSPKIRNNKDIISPLINLNINENDKGTASTKLHTDLDLQQKLIQKLANTYTANYPPPPPGIINHQNSNNSGNSNKPELMPPTMFLSSSSNEAPPPPLLPQTSAVINNSNRIIAFPLRDANNIQPVTAPTPVGRPEPLTQMQLQQAMHYLLQNDPDFIRKLHEAYLKFFNEKVSV